MVSGGVVMAVSDGMAVTTGVDVTTGGGPDRANHLSQLDETVVTTTLANPRTAIRSRLLCAAGTAIVPLEERASPCIHDKSSENTREGRATCLGKHTKTDDPAPIPILDVTRCKALTVQGGSASSRSALASPSPCTGPCHSSLLSPCKGRFSMEGTNR